jgi:hypothetical protein
MRNAERGIGKAECLTRRAELEKRNAERGMPNAE